MSRYVDAAVIPVPSDDLDGYREMATDAGEGWMNHGALAYSEGIEDDADPNDRGGPTCVSRTRRGGGERIVVFALIVFGSREHRDGVTAAVMDDPASRAHVGGDLPFEPRRMATGSLASIVGYEI